MHAFDLSSPDTDEHGFLAMDMDFGLGVPALGIVSPTPRALNFPQHALLDLDGPTPRAFTFPSGIQNTPGVDSSFKSRSAQQPSPPPSTPSTSPSPLSPASPASPLSVVAQSLAQQRILTASPAAQIPAFNAPEASGPITLAARRRGSSISSLALPPNPHAHGITLAGVSGPGGPNGGGNGSAADRKPKRGDEDYIKRPENAFILFRRECCLKKNLEEAAAAAAAAASASAPSDGPSEGARRQRQADLSKTISQQWRSLSAEERRHWDELAKQRKREHEELYPWYVYQPTRAKEKKGKAPAAPGASAPGGKARKEGARERRGSTQHREKSASRSRVRGERGARTRGNSSCSTASTASSSVRTVDSEDPYDFAGPDFEMTDADSETSSANYALGGVPLGLAMSHQLSIDTQNPLASFSLQGGSFSHHHSHGHGHGHGHSLSAQVGPQQMLGPPLSYVLPQGRRSTSAPGAPAEGLYPAIRLPTLLPTASPTPDAAAQRGDETPAESSAAPSPESHASTSSDGDADANGLSQEMRALHAFQFPAAGPLASMASMGFADLSAPAPVADYPSPGGDNNMNASPLFHVFHQQQEVPVPQTARPNRMRALSHLTIPSSPALGSPHTAPPQQPHAQALGSPGSSQPSDSSVPATPQRQLYLPGQQHSSFSPAVASPGSAHAHHQHSRSMPLNLPESPKGGLDWDQYELPSWALTTLYPAALGDAPSTTDSSITPMPGHNQDQVQGQTQEGDNGSLSGMGAFLMPSEGAIDIGIPAIPPHFAFGLDGDSFEMCDMDGSGGTDGSDPLFGLQFRFEDIFVPSQL